MNTIFKKLSNGIKSNAKTKKEYPYTLAFDKDYRCIGIMNGMKSLEDFPNAILLNIIHKNGKTTTIIN